MANSENSSSASGFFDPFVDAEKFTPEPCAEPKLQTQSFENESGAILFSRYWKPKGAPKCLVCMIHGFGEYLVSYHEVSTALANHGYLVFGHDHMGHGRSSGERATQTRIENFSLDIIVHVKKMQSHYPNTPVFAVGHSMGGMITLMAVDMEPSLFKGIVLVGPLINLHWTITLPIQKVLAILLSKIAPNFEVGKLSVNDVTADELNRERIVNDTLWWGGAVKAQMAAALVHGTNRLGTLLGSFDIPMLIIHGEKDMLCDPEGSKRLHAASKSDDKELKIYPAALHHLYLETKDIREMAVKDTLEWITKRA